MTARTKAQLETAVADGITDNTSGDITPAIHRAILEDLIDTAITNAPLVWEDLTLTTSSVALNEPGTSTRYVVPDSGDLEIAGQAGDSGSKDYGTAYWRGPAAWLVDGAALRIPIEANRFVELSVDATRQASMRANNSDVGELRRFRIRHYDG